MINYIQESLLRDGPLSADKGLLHRSDFNHLQKVMEVYAKCLLYETRLQHQLERIPYLQKNDIKGYIDKYLQQIEVEIKHFMEAQNEVRD